VADDGKEDAPLPPYAPGMFAVRRKRNDYHLLRSQEGQRYLQVIIIRYILESVDENDSSSSDDPLFQADFPTKLDATLNSHHFLSEQHDPSSCVVKDKVHYAGEIKAKLIRQILC